MTFLPKSVHVNLRARFSQRGFSEYKIRLVNFEKKTNT